MMLNYFMPQAALCNLHKCFGSLWFLFAIFTKFRCYLILHSGQSQRNSETAHCGIDLWRCDCRFSQCDSMTNVIKYLACIC